jgi:hypothetical protein
VLGQQVCSNDNKTFDSSCHFFATKCTLEGTKKGHKLHLDYIGPCKCECIRGSLQLPSPSPSPLLCNLGQISSPL